MSLFLPTLKIKISEKQVLNLQAFVQVLHFCVVFIFSFIFIFYKIPTSEAIVQEARFQKPFLKHKCLSSFEQCVSRQTTNSETPH